MKFRNYETSPSVRYTVRLVFVVLWLVLFDLMLPPLLEKLEKERYEGPAPFRFDNSDLFSLGPLVSYLREHPRGDRRRIVFLGNSVIFGYGHEARDALPAQFQRLRPGTRVFNAAINGQAIRSGYLIGKTIIDSVDGLFVQVASKEVNPMVTSMVASLIPVDESDVVEFGLRRPDVRERRLQSWGGRLWRFYGVNYRLQAALFGTSTRQFVYLHKRDIALAVLALWRRPAPKAESNPSVTEPASLRLVRATGAPKAHSRADLRNVDKTLLDFADLAYSHRKRVVFLQFDYGDYRRDHLNNSQIAVFNAVYEPWAELVVIPIPPGLRFDGQHLTAPGAQAVARALLQHDAELWRGAESR